MDITGNEKCLKSLRGSNIGMIFQNTERAMCPVRTIKSQLYESIFSNEAVKDKRKAKRIIDEKAVHMLEQMNNLKMLSRFLTVIRLSYQVE